MSVYDMTTEQKEVLKAALLKSANSWASRYETEDGELFLGRLLEETKSDMIKDGWRGISGYRLDADDCRRLGIRIVRARYVGGVRKKAFAREVIVCGPCETK